MTNRGQRSPPSHLRLLRKYPTIATPSSSAVASADGQNSSRRHEHTPPGYRAVPTSVWVSHPFHPLFLQEVTVLGPINTPEGLAFRVRYPDGSTAPLLQQWASPRPIRAVRTDAPSCPLSLSALREAAATLGAWDASGSAVPRTSSGSAPGLRKDGERPKASSRHGGKRRGEESVRRRGRGPHGTNRSGGEPAAEGTSRGGEP